MGCLGNVFCENKKRREEKRKRRGQGARKGMPGLAWFELADRVTDHCACSSD